MYSLIKKNQNVKFILVVKMEYTAVYSDHIFNSLLAYILSNQIRNLYYQYKCVY